jgi:hypothetical protein
MGDGLADERIGFRHSALILGCEPRQVNEVPKLSEKLYLYLVGDTSKLLGRTQIKLFHHTVLPLSSTDARHFIDFQNAPIG